MSKSTEYATLDSTQLRQVLGSFVTGVTVVTTVDADDQPRGMTANSFTSVSLDPPLVLVCIADTAHSFPVFNASESFAINILCENQIEVSNLFASKSPDKFSAIKWHHGLTGSPIIDASLAWIDCRIEQKLTAGDHLILLGRIEESHYRSGMPLGYFKGGYVDFASQSSLSSDDAERMVIGVIIERDDELLLSNLDDKQGWSIPNSECLASTPNARTAVKQYCRQLGIELELTFVYSIFNLEDGKNYIVYRTTINHCQPDRLVEGSRWFKINDIPWAQIHIRQISTMLKRYVKERSIDRFGIYVDSDHGGQVALLDGEPTSFEQYQSN